jgi:CRISPR type I-E-associated protein CasA/Cse1
MDIIHTPWLETDLGPVTPSKALREAREFCWGRGDWDMAGFCLLHALVQTAVVQQPSRCPDRHHWERFRNTVPSDVEDWIRLPLGDRPWECMTASGRVEVSRLLPETPGDNTMKKSSDIARWSQDVPEKLTLAQATIALISDNLWGTRIGTGFYQGARGEQPLMTLVEPQKRIASLWERVWLNVLPADEWISNQDQGSEISFEFPWKKSIPKDPLTPSNSHSLDILWPMPRRWRLIQDEDGFVRFVERQNKGRDYEGWEKLHPLTPYFVKADGQWTAAKVGPHTGFGQWSSIALQGRKKTRPATVVLAYINMAWCQEPLRLRCCGWALGDAGAPGGWIDHNVDWLKVTKAASKL